MNGTARKDQTLPSLKGVRQSDLSSKEAKVEKEKTKVQGSEFAKKLPLVPKKTLKKIAILFSLLLVFAVIGGTVFAIYSNYLKKQREQPAQLQKPLDKQPVTPPVTEKISPRFAYIKNTKILLSAGLNGENRTRLLELTGNDYKLTTLFWKGAQNITYARCPTVATRGTSCEISTLDTQSKSVLPELNDTRVTDIYKLTFSPDKNYLAYLGSKNSKTYFYFRSGTISNSFGSFLTGNNLARPQNRVFFTPDNQYVVFATKRKTVRVGTRDKRQTTEITTPVIYVYRINGVKVDEISGASDPFLIDNEKLGYVRRNKIVYRIIGNVEETVVTSFENSYNPVISEDGAKLAYWKNEGGFQDVVLGLYETNLNIHRNIIRGIVLPTWITVNRVIGITADKCVGQNCYLYEFQTTSLALVDINEGTVLTIDQGKSISELTFNQ